MSLSLLLSNCGAKATAEGREYEDVFKIGVVFFTVIGVVFVIGFVTVFVTVFVIGFVIVEPAE